MTDQERLKAGLADRYRIERELGQGGMATVYLAHDLRHDRRVALKVLRPELAAVIGAERFLAEIKTTANLQHPHILPLFDSGRVDGSVFYVMPYVQGESLRDRLVREKQLPIEEAVRIAREVADALAAAHAAGIIHRDIKPENILLHRDHALVADFGIALAASRADGSGRMTETGMSLGTPHYMSPEQALGERTLDARTDVYALGCVLYEMLAGEPPFTGPTAQAILARVMNENPRPLTAQRATVSDALEAAVQCALQKLPADRFASAQAFAAALADRNFSSGPMTALRPGARAGLRQRVRDPVQLVLGALLFASLGTIAALLLREEPVQPTPLTIRYYLSGTDSAPAIGGGQWPAAISPDGSTLVYPAMAQGSAAHMLYQQRTNSLTSSPIPGTELGDQPSFSPDGQWVVFVSPGKTKKVRLDGGAPVVLADVTLGNGVTWTVGDDLVFGAMPGRGGLSIVKPSGGELKPLTRPDSTTGERDHLWPIAFPDGRTVVFAIWKGSLATSRLAIASLDDGKVSALDVSGIRPLAILDQALVYLTADGTMMAVALDDSFRRATGAPVVVHDPVEVPYISNGNSSAFVSPGGALVSATAYIRAQLQWLGRDGNGPAISPERRGFARVRLSPDGRRLAILVVEGSATEAWVRDLASSTSSRIAAKSRVTSVAWSRDGGSILFGDNEGRVWSQSVSQGTPPTMLVRAGNGPVEGLDRSADGLALVVGVAEGDSGQILRVALDSGTAVRPFAPGREPRLSPDGRWVALAMNESQTAEAGYNQIFVRSFPDPKVKVQISTGEGFTPVWSSDGTRIYYQAGGAILAARLAMSPTPVVVSRDTISINGTWRYDVASDGRVIAAVWPQNSFRLEVVPNWLTEFRQKMAASGK